MLKVKSKVKINNMQLKRLEGAALIALEQTAEALHTEVIQAQVVPRDTGNLQNESTFVDYTNASKGKVSLVSTTPYARRMYFHPEYKFSKDENPNARGKWYEPWVSGKEKDFCRDAYKKLFKKAGGV
ncbi:MAG: hypothetical protein HFJ09_13315 [Lachnospiraceae bacterium]|nr:hypothetical protein [Lachnospiraceae bacterium]